MGFFSESKQIAKESHGRVLSMQIYQRMGELNSVSERVRFAALMGFAAKRYPFKGKIETFSKSDCIEMGADLQRIGQSKLKLNQAEGYALWLTGAWLESLSRNGPEILMAREMLDALAAEAELTLREDGFIE
jgi:hypothetical protein